MQEENISKESRKGFFTLSALRKKINKQLKQDPLCFLQSIAVIKRKYLTNQRKKKRFACIKKFWETLTLKLYFLNVFSQYCEKDSDQIAFNIVFSSPLFSKNFPFHYWNSNAEKELLFRTCFLREIL